MTATTDATEAVTPPPRGRAPRKWGGRALWASVLSLVVLLLFVVLFLIPVYVLLVTSFKPLTEADPSTAWQLPREWTTEGWVAAWDKLAPGLWNSIRLVVPGSLISAVLGSMNGFVLAKWRFPYADVVFTALLFGMFIPYQAVMIPLVDLLTRAHLMGDITGLMIAHIVYGIPICTLIFRNYFVTIPDELIEAARVDGAGMLRTYAQV